MTNINLLDKTNSMKKTVVFLLYIILTSYNGYTQNICFGIGQDSATLLANGYITGNGPCGQGIHKENKWVKITGTDSLHIHTMQHRLYDRSRIYDQNNQLIWEWVGESLGVPTWYIKNHSIYVGGNDSVKLEFYQGYTDPFCNGFMQVTKMICENNSNTCTTIGQDSTALIANGYIVGNEPCGQGVHTESKWVNVTGSDTLNIHTMQHRLFDRSSIYNHNNQLIWEWAGENSGGTTWFERNHSVYVAGSDSVRIEFYQGFADPFCNGFMQVTKMICGNPIPQNSSNVGINVLFPQRSLHIKDIIRLVPRSSAPNNPVEGDIYYDGTIKKLRVYDGTTWQNCW